MFSSLDKSNSQKRACYVRVFGRVHGVLFRRFLQQTARRLNLSGWVKNADNEERVDCFVQGSNGEVDQFLAACHHGPALARVDRAEGEEAQYDDRLSTFSII